MKVFLKGSQIKNISDFHSQIKSILHLPLYYGENLDALWDCLINDVSTPLVLVWQDFDISKIALGEYADKAKKVLKKAEKEIDDFKVEIC